MGKGIITRKDIIEDEALRWGDEYAGEIKKAISAQNELLKSAREMVSIYSQFRKANTNSEFVAAKQAEAIATQQALNALKLEETAMISSEKVKKARLATLKEEINVQSQKDRALRNSTKLTLEERVQQQENNKVFRQAILEKMGMVGAYQKLNARRNEAQKTLANLLSAEVRNNAEIRKAQKEFDILDAKIKKVDATTKNYSKNVGNYSSAFKGMWGNLSNLMGAFGVVGGVTAFATITKDIFDQTRELQSLELALKQVLGTSADLGDTQMFLTRVAEQYGVGIKELTKSYTQFYVSAKDKLSQTEINGIFESISKAAGSMGLSVEQQEGAFLALTQMLSKGTVQAEELRGQLSERLPGSFKILADSMGVTEQALNKMLKDGKVMAAEVLPEFAKQLEKAYGIENLNRVESLNASTTRLSNSWTEFIRSLEGDKGTLSSFFMFFADGITDLIVELTKLNKTKEQLLGETSSQNEANGLANTLAFIKESADAGGGSMEDWARSVKNKAVPAIAELESKLKYSEQLLKQNSSWWKRQLDPQTFNNYAKAKKMIDDYTAALGYSRGELKAADQVLAGNNSTQKKAIELTKEEIAAREKARREYERMRKKYIDGLKEEERDDFELRKNRIDYNSQANDEILKDDLATLDQKLDALNENAQLDASLSRETLEHKLKMNALEVEGLEKLSVEKFNLYIKESDARIKLLMDGQLAVKDMTIAEKILYERAENDKITLLRKTAREQQTLIDAEVDRVHKKLVQETALYERFADVDLTSENARFKKLLEAGFKNDKLRERAIEEHERNVQKIKDKYAKQEIQNQIADLENFIKNDNAKFYFERISLEKRNEILNELAALRRKFGEVELTDEQAKNEKLTELQENARDLTKEIATELKDALIELGNTLFDARISNIDDEIQKNNEKYAYLIEQAQGDADQQELLRQEGERKRQELEKKKRKEEIKAAIYNKAMAAVNIGINLAQAISAINLAAAAMDAITPYAFGAVGLAYRAVNIPLAIGVAALQLGNVLATPLPKYEKGTKNHPGGPALVGEKRPEVIKEPGKDPYIVRSQAILNLAKGTEVVPSIDEYNKLQRASFMASLQMEGKKVNDYQASQVFDQYNFQILEDKIEKGIAKGFKNARQNIIVNVPKIDIPHEIWKSKNTSWN